MRTRWNLERKELPLKFVWKIARGSLDTKEAFFLKLTHQGQTTLGEVSPNTRYHNTPERIRSDFEKFKTAVSSNPRLIELPLLEFETWLTSLNLCKTLRFGIESAWIDYQSKKAQLNVAQFLGLPEVHSVQTSFSVPMMETDQLAAFIQPLSRFASLKIKVDSASAKETLKAIFGLTQQKLRIDGNEGWKDPAELMKWVEWVRAQGRENQIEFLEQPMPSAMKDAYRDLLPRLPYPLIADESIEDEADFDDLQTQFSGINVKLMKTGSLVRAVALLKEARKRKMKTMLGCMIETSLGISMAMHLCSLVDYPDLDGFLLLKNDPFGLAQEKNGSLYFVP